MKWFNIGEIVKEIKKIRWPNVKEFFKTFGEVVVFVMLFMLFFVVADLASSGVLKLLGL